jgi:hypothetical protein
MVVAMDSHTHVLYSYHIGVLGHRGSKALDPVNVDKTNGLEKNIYCVFIFQYVVTLQRMYYRGRNETLYWCKKHTAGGA